MKCPKWKMWQKRSPIKGMTQNSFLIISKSWILQCLFRQPSIAQLAERGTVVVSSVNP